MHSSAEPSLRQDCPRLSEGTIVQCAIRERASGEQKIADHMPRVVDEPQNDEYNTRIFHERLGLPFKKYHDVSKGTESKVHRMITMERLQLLHTLTGKAFVEGWVQLTWAHYLSWCNGIQHKGISLNNLMYRRNSDNTIYAVLNDWDLSVDSCGGQTQSTLGLTGAAPFMAIDLLNQRALAGKIRHLYRHDLLWVFLWVVHCCLNGERLVPIPRIFKKWSTTDVNACGGAKYRFLRDGYTTVKPTSSWTSESPLASALLLYLRVSEARALRVAVEESKVIEEEDVSDVVWKGFWSFVREKSKCKPELHSLLDLAKLT
ncbi:hypothetical protein C8Q74DRAFT_1300676 [Fomes fomentarius]|nr:hypothetical protein C8Q74DRAFT_1300676 [Fomes fomentarius]